MTMLVYKESDHVGFTSDTTVETHYDINIYLVEIEQDRYSGYYSGHSFTAWKGARPDDISSGDPICEEFWEKYKDKAIFGGGETPQQAFIDLQNKLDKVGIYSGDETDPSKAPLKVVIVHWFGVQPKAFVYDSDEFSQWISEK